MPCTDPEMPEQERLLLNRRSLETSPPELRQPLAYVLHLRSHWRPEGRAKLIVPTSWTEFFAFADGKCGLECVMDQRCPFREVRFESGTGTRLVSPDEELPRDIVSQLLTNFGMGDCPTTFVLRAFEGISRTRLRRYARQRSLQRSQGRQASSDEPATSHFSQTRSIPRRIDFTLVPGYVDIDTENKFPENNTGSLVLGMKESTQRQHPDSTAPDTRSRHLTSASIPKELNSHGQFHLALIASLTNRETIGATTEYFPEWLVLFGLIYDAQHVRIVAFVPHRRKLDVIDCAAYIVDELPFHSSVTGVPTCELVLERLRLLLALTTLRRHVHRLSKFLFATTDPHDGIRETDNHRPFPCYSADDQHNSDDSESLDQCASLGSSQHCSSQYSTCLSSVDTREWNDDPVLEHGEELSLSCRSLVSSFCSTCLSLLESARTSDSSYTEDSKYTDFNYMESSTVSLSKEGDESVTCPNKLTKTKRREIIAWTQEVIPTEHPVKDTYRMAIYHPRLRRRVADSKSGICR